MKFLKIRLLPTIIFLLSSSSAICSNLFILNKVNPKEKGRTIYVQVAYSPLGLPMTLKKAHELRYNEGMRIIGINRLLWVRVRNVQEEQKVQSRIANIAGDERIRRVCRDYVKRNPALEKAMRSWTSFCYPSDLKKMGARLKDKMLILNESWPEIFATPIVLVVTRKPDTNDFIVTEIPERTDLLDLFGRGKFYYYLKEKDLDTYKKKKLPHNFR